MQPGANGNLDLSVKYPCYNWYIWWDCSFATFSPPPLASTLSGLTGDSQGLRLRQTYLNGEPVFVNLIFVVGIREHQPCLLGSWFIWQILQAPQSTIIQEEHFPHLSEDIKMEKCAKSKIFSNSFLPTHPPPPFPLHFPIYYKPSLWVFKFIDIPHQW